MSETRHPAGDLSEQERMDYLAVVAYMAWADKITDRAELIRLSELCATLGIVGEGVRSVVAAASAPDRAQVRQALRRFRGDSLRVALLTDLIAVTYADGRVPTGEVRTLTWISAQLNVSIEEILLIGRYVEGVVQAKPEATLTRILAAKIAALPGPVPSGALVADLVARLRERR